MTEERRIKFVCDNVIGVEEMYRFSEKISDTLVTNVQTIEKLKEEFRLSEKDSSWEEDDLVKIVLENHEALIKQNRLFQADLAKLATNLFKLASEIDPVIKQNESLQAGFAELTSQLFSLDLQSI